METALKTWAAVGGQYKHGSSRKRIGHAERIDLAQDINIWWALVNTVMNLWVP
jgi:hypothetical protein